MLLGCPQQLLRLHPHGKYPAQGACCRGHRAWSIHGCTLKAGGGVRPHTWMMRLSLAGSWPVRMRAAEHAESVVMCRCCSKVERPELSASMRCWVVNTCAHRGQRLRQRIMVGTQFSLHAWGWPAWASKGVASMPRVCAMALTDMIDWRQPRHSPRRQRLGAPELAAVRPPLWTGAQEACHSGCAAATRLACRQQSWL